MESIVVDLAENTYEVSIASGNLDRLGEKCRALRWQRKDHQFGLGEKIMVVSNPAVFKLYGAQTIAALERSNFQVSYCELPDGERYKTLKSIETIHDFALEHGLDRSSTLVALGGGVIGDMTGFAAATWLRGINVVQVPTTLLAMVDSSIGGKTGVNHPQGKNLIGAFHQPRLVLTDPQVLATLPEREFRAGMAEVIKYAIIGDPELFELLEGASGLKQDDVNSELLATILTRSARAKADVVSKDEYELTGLRATLNYGHTIGHAIESVTKYQVVNHGEAVAMGMVAAGQLAVKLNLWTAAAAHSQDAVIAKADLAIKLPAKIEIAAIIKTLKSDKKVLAGKGVFILPTKIGNTKKIAYEVSNFTNDLVSDPLIEQVLTAMLPIASN
ncbi:3-dehydroquinate synthase [Chamaesiphon sp.]|uniref:3-dehydroquinate synthase n=1 Tax=Chamaesiphon sp. TaxID=2814140 RepID=UPI0035934610